MIMTPFNNFHETYQEILESMVLHSILYGKMKMVDHLYFTLENPLNPLINIRKNWVWALHEGINRLSFEDPDLQNPGTAYEFRPNWKRKLDKEGGHRFCYSYGQEYQEQIPNIIKKLKSKSEREAILVMWHDWYLEKSINKIMARRPCTLTIHFYFFDQRLHCNVNMRTVDVMNMLPYDVFHHCLLHRHIATELGVNPGLFHFTASFAYYQKKRDTTGSVINTIEALKNSNPPEPIREWQFTDTDRKKLMEVTKLINDKVNIFGGGYNMSGFSMFGHQYAKALLYLYNKKFRKQPKEVSFLNEFEVIYK